MKRIFKLLTLIGLLLTSIAAYADVNEEINGAMDKWIGLFNSASTEIKKSYLKESGAFNLKDFIGGQNNLSKIREYKFYPTENITGYTTIDRYQRFDENYFEIGYYTTYDCSQKIYYLISWTKYAKLWRKNLEIIYDNKSTKKILAKEQAESIITEHLGIWQKLANMHDVSILVNECYNEKALYYAGNEYLGRDNITKKFIDSGMNELSFGIVLKAKTIIPVDENTIFIVGKFDSLKENVKVNETFFMQVWKKENEGKWKLMLDTD